MTEDRIEMAEDVDLLQKLLAEQTKYILPNYVNDAIINTNQIRSQFGNNNNQENTLSISAFSNTSPKLEESEGKKSNLKKK